MRNTDKTKEQLITELVEMRQQITELEASQAQRKQAEKALLEFEKKYGILMEETPVGICHLDIKGNFTYVNKTILQVTGYSTEELVGKNGFRLGLVSPETAKVLARRLKQKLMGEPPRPIEIQFKCKDGKWIWLEIRGRLLRQHGLPASVQIIGQDITHRKQTEQKLKVSEEHYRLITESASDIIALATFDLHPVFTYVSPSIKAFGYEPQDLIGKPCFDFIHPDDKKGLLPLLKQYVTAKAKKLLTGRESPITETIEYRARDKSGNWRYMQATANLVGNQILLVNRDITEHKQMDEALKLQKAHFQQLFDNSPEGIALLDDADRVVDANKGFETLFGYQIEEIKGRFINELIIPEDRIEESSSLSQATLSGQAVRKETVRKRKDGSLVDVSILGYPIHLGNKQVGAYAIYSNITERKRAEEQFQTLVNNAPLGLSLISKNGTYEYVNAKFVDIFGYTLEDIPTGKEWLEKAYPDPKYRQKVVTCWLDDLGKANLGEVRPQTFVVTCKDGATKDIEFRPVTLTNGQQIVTYEDITNRKQAEEALRESNRRFEDIAENASEWIWETNADGKYTYTSPLIEKILGYKPEEVLEKHFYDLFHPDDREELKKAAFEVFAKKQPFRELINRNIHKNGETVWLSTSGVPILDEEGNLLGYRGADIDITHRKQAEEALRESEERFRSVVENSHDGILIADDAYRFIYVNDELCRILEYPREEIIGQDFRKFLDDESTQLVADRYIRRQRGEKVPPQYEFNIVRKSGEKRRVEISSTVIKDSAGKVKSVSQILDITHRKQAEEVLRQSEEFNSSLLSNSPIPIHVINPDTSIRYVNTALERLTGFSAAEVIGLRAPYPWWPEETLRETFRDFREATHKGVERVEELFQKKNGELFWVEVTFMPVMLDGNLRYYLSSWVDITERKQINESLEESEKKYRILFQESRDALFISTQDGKLVDTNQAFLELFGYTRDEAIGLDVRKTYANPDDRLKYRHEIEQKGAVRDYELKLQKKDGTELNCLLTATVRQTKDGDILGYHGFIRDITYHKQMEEALRREKETFLSILQKAPYGVVLVSPDGSYLYANPEFTSITGYTLEDTITGRDWFHKAYPDPEYRHKVIETWKKDLPYGGKNRVFSVVCHNGEVKDIEFKPTLLDDGNILQTLSDITERKKMQEQLIITDRLASIGELASGLAHELNNPLTSVIGFSQLLLDKDVSDDVREDVETIYKEAQRTADVVKNLLTFARKHALVKQPVALNSIIDKVLELRAYEQRVNNIHVNTHFAPDLPEIVADYFQFQQVFLNIVINAEHFMIETHNRGTLTITTQRKNGIVRATFTDDGPGISKENLGHLFDPFFTTKEVGKGTGLGLSICHGIVTEHGGRIYALSQPGKGATFIIELPITDTTDEVGEVK